MRARNARQRVASSLANRLLASAAGVLILAFGAGRACAQAADSTLWITDGSVLAIARDPSTIYLGGLFTRVGPATGGGVSLNASNGALARTYPRVTGTVAATLNSKGPAR